MPSTLPTVPFIAPAKTKSPVAPLERLLDKKQVAEILGCSTRSVERLIAKGQLPPVHVFARVKFDPADVRRLIDSLKKPPLEAAS